jgi:hydrogenase expression/formation protein HypE
MAGARARWLSAGFILEEGLPLETLWRIVRSMGAAAQRVDVRIVTGDTKVVERGKGDGVFINTAGVGEVVAPAPVGPAQIRPGDAVLLSGDLGRHGIAVMASREGIEFESAIESDLAPLQDTVLAMLDAGIGVHCLRDLTRGGLASALNELAEGAGVSIEVDEKRIAVEENVRGACELLGFDPLYVANEGRFVAFVAAADAERALAILQAEHANAATIGRVGAGGGRVTLRTTLGTSRILDMLSGEQLPRIC